MVAAHADEAGRRAPATDQTHEATEAAYPAEAVEGRQVMTELATTALTPDEARALTGEIRQRLDGLLPLIKRAYEGRADRALGYESWQAYCAAELNDVRVPLADRPASVAELRAAGMSTRAIGAALGVDDRTVRRDLATAAHAAVELPDRITSLDGRERPATRPTPQTPAIQPEPAPAAHDVAAGAGNDHPEQRKPNRRPLPAVAEDAGWELRRTVDKVARITADDRFDANKQQVAAHLHGHLTYAVETLQQALDHLNHQESSSGS